jgi:hypothetical protein
MPTSGMSARCAFGKGTLHYFVARDLCTQLYRYLAPHCMSSGTKRNNARIREEQTEHILEAARLLFAHRGYSDTTMTEIAAAAGVRYGIAG